MNKYDRFVSTLHNFKKVYIDGAYTLVIENCRTGEIFNLDLSLLDDEMFESLIIDESEDDDYESIFWNTDGF